MKNLVKMLFGMIFLLAFTIVTTSCLVAKSSLGVENPIAIVMNVPSVQNQFDVIDYGVEKSYINYNILSIQNVPEESLIGVNNNIIRVGSINKFVIINGRTNLIKESSPYNSIMKEISFDSMNKLLRC